MFSGNILSNLYKRSPFKATLLPLTASRLGIPSHQRKLFFSLGKIRTLHVVSAAGVLRIRHHPTARCRGLFASPCLTVQRLGGGDEDAPSAYAHLHLIDEEPCEYSARGSMRGASAARSIAYCIPVLSSSCSACLAIEENWPKVSTRICSPAAVPCQATKWKGPRRGQLRPETWTRKLSAAFFACVFRPARSCRSAITTLYFFRSNGQRAGAFLVTARRPSRSCSHAN
jgi:hypothetical protein